MKLAALVMLMASCLPATRDTDPPPSDCSEQAPMVEVWDCDVWSTLYRCIGATEREVTALEWLAGRESGCGQRMWNPTSSDIGYVQLNGIHGKPGWYDGTYWAEGWAVELYGLAPYTNLANWRSNTTTSDGQVRVARASLHLLRGGTEPDTFRGCSNWRHRGWRRGNGCGVA